MTSHSNISLIIDGYNLLYAMGILEDGKHPRAFELARQRLLGKIAHALKPSERVETAIIFDANAPRRGGESTQVIHGLQVFFAVDYDEADTMIEELIRTSSTPKKLTIISSDHRLQGAARRRKAAYIDSDTWLYDVIEIDQVNRDSDVKPITNTESKPTLNAANVKAWLEEFGDVEIDDVLSDNDADNTDNNTIRNDVDQTTVQDWVDIFSEDLEEE